MANERDLKIRLYKKLWERLELSSRSTKINVSTNANIRHFYIKMNYYQIFIKLFIIIFDSIKD
jgi:hypothetical protein